jgi:hypothetical protein
LVTANPWADAVLAPTRANPNTQTDAKTANFLESCWPCEFILIIINEQLLFLLYGKDADDRVMLRVEPEGPLKTV